MNCFSEGIFLRLQLCGAEEMIKKVHKGQHSRNVVFSDLPANQHNSGSGKGGNITWLGLCSN